MNREQKKHLVESVSTKLISSAFVAIVHYRGMTDKQLYEFRLALKSKGCSMKIAKNTLVKVAIRKTDLEQLNDYLSGPTAVLCSQDPIALSRVVVETSKQVEHLKIKAGFFNKAIVNEAAIRDMAKLGSIEEVRASFVGLLSAKQANFVRLLTAPEKGLAANKTN